LRKAFGLECDFIQRDKISFACANLPFVLRNIFYRRERS